MKNWYKNLSPRAKYAVIGAGIVLLLIAIYLLYRYFNRNQAIGKAADKAKKQQGLQAYGGRPTTQAEWDEFDAALRSVLGMKENFKDAGAAELMYSQAMGFFKGLNLSWKNMIYFRQELAEYINNGGETEQFVTVGQYL